MASQLQSVTRDRRLRVDQDAQLQARMQMLPQIMANQASRRIEKKQDAQFERTLALRQDEFSLQKKRTKLQERQDQANMGLSAATFGTNFAFGDAGKTTVSEMFGGAKKMVGLGKGGTTGMPGLIGGITAGQILGSGLTGYGVSKMVGGSKVKKAGYGALAGGLMGLLSGGANKGLSGAATKFGMGAVLGGLGGLF